MDCLRLCCDYSFDYVTKTTTQAKAKKNMLSAVLGKWLILAENLPPAQRKERPRESEGMLPLLLKGNQFHGQ